MRPREVGAEVVVTGGPAADARAEPLGLEGSASLGGQASGAVGGAGSFGVNLLKGRWQARRGCQGLGFSWAGGCCLLGPSHRGCR